MSGLFTSASEVLLWPAAAFLFVVPLAVWAALVAMERRRATAIARTVGPRIDELSDLDPRRRRRRRWLRVGGLASVVVALAQPTFGVAERVLERRGVDLVVCLDVSRSMLAGDVEPSRLVAAKRDIGELLDQLAGDRVALVAFAGDARLMVPLTEDVASFRGLLELADPLAVTRGGTDLGAALEVAADALSVDDVGPAAIILMTDGEDLGARGLAVTQRYATEGVAVHCVGYGSPAGSKIPATDADGSAFQRDATGADVLTSLDRDGLRAIANAGEGAYREASTGGVLAELYRDRLLASAPRAVVGERRDDRANRFQWPLLIAVMLWIAELALADRRAR